MLLCYILSLSELSSLGGGEYLDLAVYLFVAEALAGSNRTANGTNGTFLVLVIKGENAG